MLAPPSCCLMVWVPFSLLFSAGQSHLCTSPVARRDSTPRHSSFWHPLFFSGDYDPLARLTAGRSEKGARWRELSTIDENQLATSHMIRSEVFMVTAASSPLDANERHCGR